MTERELYQLSSLLKRLYADLPPDQYKFTVPILKTIIYVQDIALEPKSNQDQDQE